MAWKVYAAMPGQDGNPRYPSRMATIYGPLPCKRWVPMKGERYRVKRKVTNGTRGNPPRDDTGQAVQALEYAQWLARRDGIELPKGATPCIAWVTIPSHTKRTATGRPVMFKRCSSVKWGAVKIDIPNWNWEPREPVETINADQLELEAA